MPDLLRGTWHGVLRCCKLKECGDRIRRMLAIQFSKTELYPRDRDLVSNPILEHDGSREGNRSASRGGVYLLPLPGFVKTFVEPKLAVRPDLWGPDFYLRSPARVKRALPNRFRASVSLPSGGCFYSHPAIRVKRKTAPFVPASTRLKGRCFYPSILLPSTPSGRPRHRAPDCLPMLQGRCFYPLGGGPVNCVPEEFCCFLPGLRRRGA